MEILNKISQYCAYQERSQKEVREKLRSMGINSDESEEIIAYLIVEGFINEERFARQYAGSKFRVKKWGKRKIVSALKMKGISEYCIRQGLAEIDSEDYLNTLEDLAERKRESLPEHLLMVEKKQKTYQYLISKGYESQLIGDIMRAWK